MTIRLSYATERTLNLNVSAYQLVEQAKKDFTLGLGYTIANFNRVLGIKDKKNSTFSNDLKISGDVTYSRSYNLLRKIEEGYTQATQGVTNFKLSFSAEYAMSKALTLKAFLEHITNTPLVSANSYPTATTDFGISIRFQLMQ
jgi:cell surface protein SprA